MQEEVFTSKKSHKTCFHPRNGSALHGWPSSQRRKVTSGQVEAGKAVFCNRFCATPSLAGLMGTEAIYVCTSTLKDKKGVQST